MADKRGSSAFQTNLGCPFAAEVYSDYYQSMFTGVANGDKLQGKLALQGAVVFAVGLPAIAYYFQTSFCF